jgi:hypothetical protein
VDWFLVKDLEDVDINSPCQRSRGVSWVLMVLTWSRVMIVEANEASWIFSIQHATVHNLSDDEKKNAKLILQGDDVRTYAELLRFFGVCILITHHEFAERRDL